MLDKKELLKKKMEEAKLNNELEQLAIEEQRLKEANLTDSIENPLEPEDEINYIYNLSPTLNKKDDWKEIVADYKKAYPDRPCENKRLAFNTREEAMDFFTAQATKQPPRRFLAQEHIHNEPTGFHVFSCGNNKLYQGSLQDIQSQLKTDLIKQPDDLNTKQGLELITKHLNPASEFKSALNEAKASTKLDETPTTSLPNPLSTKPKSPFEK